MINYPLDLPLMSDGAQFSLRPAYLGRNAFGEIHLLAAFRCALEALANELPGAALYDVLDGTNERMTRPSAPEDFSEPVEVFDIPPEAPHAVVVYDGALADRLAAAFPELSRGPRHKPDGVAFELGAADLVRDPFGLTHLAPDVLAALEETRRMMPDAHVRLLAADGEPVHDRPSSFAEQLVPFAEETFSALNGSEPHWLVLPPPVAAAFAQHRPGLSQCRLADLEALWRRARRDG